MKIQVHTKTDERINKMWYSNTMEYYLTVKRHGALTHDKTWMNLESTLSERSQTQKAIYLTIPFT